MRNLFVFYANYFRQSVLKQRIKPRVLQMPVTSRCNSRCVTCKVWCTPGKYDMDAKALKEALSDPFFSKVEVVGINGGEPSLYKNMEALLDALFVLKRLKRLHVISNAMLADRLLPMMRTLKQHCAKREVMVYLTVSMDGVEAVHDEVRGVAGAFAKTLHTLKALRENQTEYCDVLDIGCTLSQKNVDFVVQTECFADSLGIDAYYHPAVPNRRLHNFGATDFGVLYDRRSLQLSTEYFYCRYKNAKGLRHKLRSYLTWSYLANKGRGRLAGCQYLRSDVTITETLDLFLCATASEKVGNLKEKSATELWKSGRMEQEARHVQRYCESCVHYIVFPSLRGIWCFVKQVLHPHVWILYKLKSLCLK